MWRAASGDLTVPGTSGVQANGRHLLDLDRDALEFAVSGQDGVTLLNRLVMRDYMWI